VANYLAAILIVAAVALFVAAPLSGGFPRRRRSTSLQLDLERLEHERGLAVQGLRELEFDHEMGKLDEVDYRDLQRALEDRALSAMTAIERARTADRAAAPTPDIVTAVSAAPGIERDAEGMAGRRLAARPPRPASALALGIAPASASAPSPSTALASSPATDRTGEHGRAGGAIVREDDNLGVVEAPGTAPAPVGQAAASPPPARRASTTRRMPGAAGTGHPPLVNFCPQCGVRVGIGHNFCAECGAKLSPAAARIASRAE
jgi:hypothetical protein